METVRWLELASQFDSDNLKQIDERCGRVAIRKNGRFRIGDVDGISHRYCHLVQSCDGYEYSNKSQLALSSLSKYECIS